MSDSSDCSNLCAICSNGAFCTDVQARVYDYRLASQERVMMPPRTFLVLAGPQTPSMTGNTPPPVPRHSSTDFPWFDRGSYNTVAGRIHHRQLLDPLFLDVNPDTLEVMGHEGRHRALAAWESGCAEVPVILFHRDSHGEFLPATRKLAPRLHARDVSPEIGGF